MLDYSLTLRALLAVGSLLTVVFVLSRIRRSKMQIEDSIFWFVFSALLLLISIFPELAFWAARLLGIQAPINAVYLAIIFLLILKVFFLSVRVSQLDSKVKVLVQKVALNEEKIEREHLDR